MDQFESSWYPGTKIKLWQVVEKHLFRHCEERFSRRGNLELIDLFNYEIASLRTLHSR